MNTATQTAVKAESGTASIVIAALMGLSILFIAGFASSATLHDSAHDTRHVIGFACH